MFTQYVTAGFFESYSLWIPAFMAIDKLHWLPSHSLMLMLDQLHCRPIFSVLPAHCWPQVWKNILSWYLSHIMSGNALPFVGNFYIIVFANTFQIQTKYQMWSSIQIHQISLLKYIYVYGPNPGWDITKYLFSQKLHYKLIKTCFKWQMSHWWKTVNKIDVRQQPTNVCRPVTPTNLSHKGCSADKNAASKHDLQ